MTTWAGAIRGDATRAFRVSFNFLVVTLKGVETVELTLMINFICLNVS